MNPLLSQLSALVQFPVRAFLALGKSSGLSLAASVGGFVGVSLFVVLSLPFLLQTTGLSGGHHSVIPQQFFWPILVSVIAAVIGVSVLSGILAQKWLIQLPATFSDIKDSWEQGLAELRQAGIQISDHPIYLVLGFPENRSVRSFMQASRLNMKFTPKITGDESPLMWFAVEKDNGVALMLFLCNCCQTSLISSDGPIESSVIGDAAPLPVGTIENFDLSLPREYLGVEEPVPSQNSTPCMVDYNASIGNQPTMGDEDDSMDHLQTVMGDEESQTEVVHVMPSVVPKLISASPGLKLKRLEPETAAKANQRLQYVCSLLKTAREPDCPVSGIICSVPFPFLMADGPSQGQSIGQMTRSDLTIVTTELQTKAHVVALVHGLELNDDFSSLVRRLRNEATGDVDRRVGKGIGTWVEIRRETLEDLAICSCETFQRLIYKLLMSAQALKRVDNGSLYRLIMTIRGRFLNNLRSWLVTSFLPLDFRILAEGNGDEIPQLAGCYFIAAQPAASEEDSKEQLIFAHVTGVFEKLFELESHRTWLRSALSKDLACRKTANLLMFLTLAAGFVAMAGLIGLVMHR